MNQATQIFSQPDAAAPVAEAATPAADALEHVNRGARAHLAGDLEAARRAYRAALDADPRHATALTNLGFLAGQER
ncbi:MAG TPA: hypothetical protein VHQ65_02555, partial [Thermoanaerobaculia bacterium]|nr:hypothetical protein [Thermoanaerobaculia bacterium]